LSDPYTLKEFDALVKGPGLFGLHLTRLRATLERLEALASDREQIQKTLHEAIDERNAAIAQRDHYEAALRLAQKWLGRTEWGEGMAEMYRTINMVEATLNKPHPWAKPEGAP
jgi:multidrug resistance efflux pump